MAAMGIGAPVCAHMCDSVFEACRGVFVATDTNFYLQSCWSGVLGDGFNPNKLSFQAGTPIPYQLIISKVNVV
jgi:hypothetical protein